MADSTPRILYRSDTDKMIGGVAGGLGEYFAVDPVIFRLLFIILTFAGGAGIFLYAVCWFLIPSRGNVRANFEDSVKANANSIAQDLEKGWERGNGNVVIGFILAGLGLFFLLVNFGVLTAMAIGKLWPIVLILVGLQIFISGSRK